MDKKELKNDENNVIVDDSEELLEIYKRFLEDFERLDNFIHKRIAEVSPEKHTGGMTSSLYDDVMKRKKKDG